MVKKFKQDDYPKREIEACKRVLMEILNLLKEYADHIALVGGWVPYYMVPEKSDQHTGSLDVDICFDLQWISEVAYETILNTLRENGYYQTNQNKPFQWWKDVIVDDGKPISVEVDLLSSEYGGRGKNHEHQNIQDIKARKARGSDLIFGMGEKNRFKEIILEGRLPNGDRDSVRFKIAGVVPFLVMKGMAIGRGKPKDAYDIEFVIANYPDGFDALVSEFKEDLDHPLVLEGLGKIRTKFESVEHTGPSDITRFEDIQPKDERDIRARKAYETVNEFLDALKINRVL